MEIYESAQTLLLYCGYYVLAIWFYRFACIVWRHYLGVQASTERYGDDSWAVITGATDELGKASALHLASLGFSIVMIDSNAEKLLSLVKEI